MGCWCALYKICSTSNWNCGEKFSPNQVLVHLEMCMDQLWWKDPRMTWSRRLWSQNALMDVEFLSLFQIKMKKNKFLLFFSLSFSFTNWIFTFVAIVIFIPAAIFLIKKVIIAWGKWQVFWLMDYMTICLWGGFE